MAILPSERQHPFPRTGQIQTKELLHQKLQRQGYALQPLHASVRCRSRQADYTGAKVRRTAGSKIFQPKRRLLFPLHRLQFFCTDFHPLTSYENNSHSCIRNFLCKVGKTFEEPPLGIPDRPGAMAINLSFGSIRFSEKNRSPVFPRLLESDKRWKFFFRNALMLSAFNKREIAFNLMEALFIANHFRKKESPGTSVLRLSDLDRNPAQRRNDGAAKRPVWNKCNILDSVRFYPARNRKHSTQSPVTFSFVIFYD